MDFPRWMHHPGGNSFICPSQEFLDSLVDKDEWETEPFTGPRAIVKEKCASCWKLRQEIVALKLQVVEKDILIEQLQAKRGPGRPKQVHE